MIFRNYAQHLPYWLCINVQGLFAKALKLKDGHLRLIFTYDTSDVDYSPRDRYGYASEQHFYYPMAFGAAKRRPWDPFTGVRRLEIRGANPCAVFMTVEVCPDLEVLETDVDEKIIRAGFDVANTRPPASVYFFSNYNWHHPTEEMQWPNRRRNASAEKSAQPPYVLPSGAENLPSMRIIRQRKSISPLRTLCHILSLSSHRRFHYVRLVLSPSAYSLIKKGMFYLFQLLLMYLAGSESPRYLPPNASVFERGRADCARRARQRHPRKVRLAYDEPRHRHLPVWPAFKSGSHRDRPQSQHF